MLLFELVAHFAVFSFDNGDFLCFNSHFSLFFCTFDVKEITRFNHLAFFIDKMNNTDWKEALGKAFNLPVNEEPTVDGNEAQTPEDRADAVQQQGTARLDVLLERKGRAGKQATIVTGFTCDEQALRQVASRLKSSLGVGGSARGGEILIQGDFRQRVLDLLREMGFKARII